MTPVWWLPSCDSSLVTLVWWLQSGDSSLVTPVLWLQSGDFSLVTPIWWLQSGDSEQFSSQFPLFCVVEKWPLKKAVSAPGQSLSSHEIDIWAQNQNTSKPRPDKLINGRKIQILIAWLCTPSLSIKHEIYLNSDPGWDSFHWSFIIDIDLGFVRGKIKILSKQCKPQPCFSDLIKYNANDSIPDNLMIEQGLI